ncbi:MAG TPA: MaoC family dehydratase [Gammaproteobacteria bacterium]|nr:MaoC family dehydratase [Gammaproteobacteria bacterium]
MSLIKIDGPYFEEFSRGQLFAAPSITVTDGHAAVYSALFGDRMRLPLDRHLSRRVTGDERPLAHSYLAVHLAAGQTTYASQHVKGNLFYRGMLLRKPVFVGDSLYTTTKVVGLKQNKVKPGRAATGMVALEMTTVNQRDEVVLHFWRCPMIACRDPQADTGHDDDFGWIPNSFDEAALLGALPGGWNLAPLASELTGLRAPAIAVGDEVEIGPQDTVTCAPELVRMSLNIAYTHTDATKSYLGERLVYGGHTISFALAQVVRGLPNLLAMVAWRYCDHLAPVLEGDIISTRFKLVGLVEAPQGGRLYDLEIEASATRRDKASGEYRTEKVLAWGLVAWGA